MTEKLCQKCGQRLDPGEEHHLWCKFMDNPHGNAYPGYVSRIILCSECHRYDKNCIHNLIISILKKYSTSTSNIDWRLWKEVSEEKKAECIKEVVTKSWVWLHEVNDERTSKA